MSSLCICWCICDLRVCWSMYTYTCIEAIMYACISVYMWRREDNFRGHSLGGMTLFMKLSVSLSGISRIRVGCLDRNLPIFGEITNLHHYTCQCYLGSGFQTQILVFNLQVFCQLSQLPSAFTITSPKKGPYFLSQSRLTTSYVNSRV